MLRRVVVVALLLSLPPIPLAAAAHTVAVGVDGPDPDGAYNLSFEIHRDSAGWVSLSLDVARTDADGTLRAARDLGGADLAAGSTRRDVAFLPAEGAGRYVVALVVAGARSEELSFDVDDATAAAALRFHVPDEPTYLNLTSDAVNADGKTKSPGEPLLTRGTLTDANGLADIDAFVWSVEAGGTDRLSGAIALPANETAWSFEHRFDLAPFEAGNYTLRLRALKASEPVASASRTFVIRDVAPTFVSGALANVTPDADATQTTSIVLADKNGLPGEAPEARVYRGSARAEGAGLVATLGAPARLADADGAARVAYPLALRVPAGASAGAYRVSLYVGGSLLASLPFEVRALPSLEAVEAATEEGRLALAARGGGDGILVARLSDGAGATTSVSAAFVNGSGSLLLDPPRRGAPLSWNLSLHARADGPALASREGGWTAPTDGPSVTLAPLHVRARLPAAWRVEAPGPLDDANASFAFRRWDGQTEPRIEARLQEGRLRVDAPPDLPAGRYSGELTLVWPNGTVSRAVWSFDAGPWVELLVGEPRVEGRTATVEVRNVGGVAVSRLVVETEPRAQVALARAGEPVPAGAAGARMPFRVALAPGEEATLRVSLPDGPLRSGQHHVALRVLARVSLA